MPELEINTLIRAIIIVIVIALVVGSLFLIWINYIKPRLEGLAVIPLIKILYGKL